MAIRLALENTGTSGASSTISTVDLIVGEAVYYSGPRATLKRIRFKLAEKFGSVTGNIRASIYDTLTGTFGTDMRPENNPTPLSQSSLVSMNNLTSTLTEYEFIFPSGVFLTPDTYYCITLNYIDTDNPVSYEGDGVGSSYEGNSFRYRSTDTWVTSTKDLWFKLYTGSPNPLPGNV